MRGRRFRSRGSTRSQPECGQCLSIPSSDAVPTDAQILACFPCWRFWCEQVSSLRNGEVASGDRQESRKQQLFSVSVHHGYSHAAADLCTHRDLLLAAPYLDHGPLCLSPVWRSIRWESPRDGSWISPILNIGSGFRLCDLTQMGRRWSRLVSKFSSVRRVPLLPFSACY